MFFGDSKVTPATAAIDPELAAALALAAAVLSIKMALTHVMVARARMTLGQVVGTNVLMVFWERLIPEAAIGKLIAKL